MIHQQDFTTSTPHALVNLIVTSPPYNVGIDYGGFHADDMSRSDYESFIKRFFLKSNEWLTPSGRICINVPLYNSQNVRMDMQWLMIAENTGWQHKATFVWDKGVSSTSTAYGSFAMASAPNFSSNTEVILVLHRQGIEWKRPDKGTSTISGQDFLLFSDGIWRIKPARRNGHPVPYPIEIPERCIQLFSYQEDTILDPFCGSGTTLLAARNLGRKYVGFDVNPEYVKLATQQLGFPTKMALDMG